MTPRRRVDVSLPDLVNQHSYEEYHFQLVEDGGRELLRVDAAAEDNLGRRRGEDLLEDGDLIRLEDNEEDGSGDNNLLGLEGDREEDLLHDLATEEDNNLLRLDRGARNLLEDEDRDMELLRSAEADPDLLHITEEEQQDLLRIDEDRDLVLGGHPLEDGRNNAADHLLMLEVDRQPPRRPTRQPRLEDRRPSDLLHIVEEEEQQPRDLIEFEVEQRRREELVLFEEGEDLLLHEQQERDELDVFRHSKHL